MAKSKRGMKREHVSHTLVGESRRIHVLMNKFFWGVHTGEHRPPPAGHGDPFSECQKVKRVQVRKQ